MGGGGAGGFGSGEGFAVSLRVLPGAAQFRIGLEDSSEVGGLGGWIGDLGWRGGGIFVCGRAFRIGCCVEIEGGLAGSGLRGDAVSRPRISSSVGGGRGERVNGDADALRVDRVPACAAWSWGRDRGGALVFEALRARLDVAGIWKTSICGAVRFWVDYAVWGTSKRDSSTACPGASRKGKCAGHFARNDGNVNGAPVGGRRMARR